MQSIRHIALILNINKPYDRKIVDGVARYMREAGNWSLYLEDDPLNKIPNFNSWNGDGIIADLDDANVYNAVKGLDIPVIGFGGGYGPYREDDNIPYIFTDNTQIAEMAAEHLTERGFTNFAYCGFPANSINGWCAEREKVFTETIQSKGYNCSTYTGKSASAKNWKTVQEGLMKWLNSLEFPTGLMASNDSRARHVLEACFRLGIKVPEEIAVVGVDNDEMMCELANPPLSSIIQGTDKLGFHAAKLLDNMIDRKSVPGQTTVDPQGLVVRQSSDILAINDELISRALAFVREQACYGIRVEDVVYHCDISRSTLEKKFKSVIGRTVHAEISRMQIKKVKELLVHTEMPLKKIFGMCGFGTLQYMALKFKAETGMTPNKYRQQSR